MRIASNVPVKNQTIEAVITRADGRVERLGVISYYDRNPLKRTWFRIRRLFGPVHHV